MPRYRYKAQNNAGKKVKGLQYADNESELHAKLKASGLFLVSFNSGEVSRANIFKSVFKPNLLSDFNRQLGQLVGSGISLVRSLSIMIQEESLRPRQKAIYEDILRLIRQGMPISEALEEQNAFPPLMISMYRAAEAGGNIEKIANRLAVSYDKEYRLNMKIKNASAYTKVLCALTILVLVAMFAFILPKFEGMFANIKLPASTRFLFYVRDLFKYHWLIVFISAAVVTLIIRSLLEFTAVTVFKDKVKLHIPVIGRLLKTVYTSRFARTLSLLYTAGLPIVSALQTSKDTIGNEYIKRQFSTVISDVRAGGDLSSAIDKVQGFNKKLSASIHIGEEAGALDNMLNSVSDVLEYEAEVSMTKLVGFLEPVLIVLMAFIVGFIVISIITPVFSSYSHFPGLKN